MKHLIPILLLFTLSPFHPFTLSAAVPLRWTVETSRVQPATFEAYQGETLNFEATLQSYGKPLAAPSEYAIYWQTNGMGSAWWSAPITQSQITQSPNHPISNVLYATWSPDMDVGAKVYSCFIGLSNSIYRAAFQLRLRPSPGAVPNALPLPTPVIDFAKVTVLNPPWPSDGSARYTPKYLWIYDCADSYPDAAAEYYRSRGNGKTDGGCSAVRDGGYLSRNFDYPFDNRAEFIVRCVATAPSPSCPNGRYASVGVAQVGTNLTEAIVTSGKPNRCYKWLPGATVDGVNENGVVAEINVVDGDPQTSGWHTTGDLHPLGAIRWILDHATNAQHGAIYIAAHIAFPQGWEQNFHYMIADAEKTYIVENGSAHDVTDGVPAITNFRLYPTPSDGEGQERYVALTNGANITSQWWTLTYTASGYRASDLPGITGEDLANLFNYWENNPRESHRGERFGDKVWWHSIHTSIYDITNRTLRIAVQETPDWYTFAVPGAGCVKPETVREIVEPIIGAATNAMDAAKRDKTDLKVYGTSGNFGISGFQGYGYDTDLWTWDSARHNWNYGEDQDSYFIEGTYTDGVFRFTVHYGSETYEWTGLKKTKVAVIEGQDLFFEPVFADTLATSNGVVAAIAAKADKTEIPTKTSQLENDSGYFSTHDGYTTNVLAKISHPVLPHTWGSAYGGQTWTNELTVTVLDALGSANGYTFAPAASPRVRIRALNAEAVEEYDPDLQTWVLTGEWTTNDFVDATLSLSFEEYGYGEDIYRSWSGHLSGCDVSFYVGGDATPSSSVSWNASWPYGSDGGEFPVDQVLDVVDRFLGESELRKLVPHVTETRNSTVTRSNTVYQVLEITNNVVRTTEHHHYHETTNRTTEVWHEVSREIVPTNVSLQAGQVFRGLAMTETNLTHVVPVIGDVPTIRLDVPYRQTVSVGGMFSAIEIGNWYQVLFAQRIQAGCGIWVPDARSIRFYSGLGTNEYDSCSTLQDVLDDMDIGAIRRELNSGFVSSGGANLPESDFVFGKIDAAGRIYSPAIFGNDASVTNLAAGSIEAGRLNVSGDTTVRAITASGKVTAQQVQVPSIGDIKFGSNGRLDALVSEAIDRKFDNPHGSYPEPDPAITRGEAFRIFVEGIANRFAKYSTVETGGESWVATLSGHRYVASTNFYYNSERSTATKILISYPGVSYRTLAPPQSIEYSNYWNVDDDSDFDIWIVGESVPAGVVYYLPWKVYAYRGWTIRYYGDVIRDVLAPGDILHVWTGDGHVLNVEYHHMNTYTPN